MTEAETGNRKPETGARAEAWYAALAAPGVQGLRAYDPGHDLVALRRRFRDRAMVELGSNENPYGPSPHVLEAVQAVLHDLHRYPDPLGGELKRTLAARHGIDPAQILLGNGSHELLMQFAQVFAGPGCEVVISQFGFAVYALAAQAAGAVLHVAPALGRAHPMPRGHDLDAIATHVTPATRLVYLANPNNPTGTWFDGAAFQAFLTRVRADVLVVIDEAYGEFADARGYASALPLCAGHPNLIVTRTFSKAYAIAGLRVGYAVAQAGLVEVMERMRESFNVNTPGLVAAVAALADEPHLRRTLAYNAGQRTELADALRTRGWFVHPSQTNFLLVEFGAGTAAIEAALLAQGVVVRPMAGYGLPDCLRITVGDAGENRRLLQALDAACV